MFFHLEARCLKSLLFGVENFSVLTFFSEPHPAFSSLEPSKTSHFKIRPSEDKKHKSLIFYVPRT